MGQNFSLFLRFYYRPSRAASDAVDQGSFGFALVMVGLTVLIGRFLGAKYSLHAPFPLTLVQLAAWFLVLTPVSIAVIAAWDSLGSASVVLRREYVSVLICAMLSWTAAHLPVALSQAVLPLPILWPIAHLAFIGLFVVCLRTALGTSATHAIVATVAGWIAAAGFLMLWPLVGRFSYFLFSPWILYLLYRYYSADVRSLGDAMDSRRNFRRQLEASMVNPHDADAHYQLGLIYMQRRQFGEAEASFRRAAQIQPDEAESRLQLGRALRALNRHSDALPQFQAAVQLDPSVSSQEAWRDLGGTLLELDRADEAEVALERYTQHRPYDPEGLVLYGTALRRRGKDGEARDAFQQAVEAVETAPRYRRGQLRKWAKQASSELKALS